MGFANCWINFACINKKNANIITKKKSKECLKIAEYANAETYKYWIVCKDPDSFSEKSRTIGNIEIMQTLELLKSERIF